MADPSPRKETRHLPAELWRTIQASVPIFCVDVVPLRRGPRGLELGLIRRETPSGEQRWCFIGGRLLLDELIEEAVQRELNDAIGTSLRHVEEEAPRPLLVEYRRSGGNHEPVDPRQHAVSSTRFLWMAGEGIAHGIEALEFRWWPSPDLSKDIMGFGQHTIIPRIEEAARLLG